MFAVLLSMDNTITNKIQKKSALTLDFVNMFSHSYKLEITSSLPTLILTFYSFHINIGNKKFFTQ